MFTAFHVFIIPYFYRFSIFFSKKVGQPLHSKFLQSLDSTGFFIFVKIGSKVHRLFSLFLLFSAPFHAVLSWRPWFYWVGGSPTFFTDFLTIFVLIKEKASVLSQKLKPLLNISITPAIRPSPYIHALHLYSATRKISLSFGERPLTSYPGFRPSLHRNGYLQISPSIQIFPKLFLPYGYFHRLLPLYVDFSTVKAECIIGFTSVIPAATLISLRLIPAPQASIAAPGSSVQLSANISAICVFLDGFRLPGIHHWTPTTSRSRYPCSGQPDLLTLPAIGDFTAHLEALAYFIHRVDCRHDSNIQIWNCHLSADQT